jgi:23S rRNA pseudouridine1911/1915/1917 synthase
LNEGFEYREQVEAAAAGRSVLAYLADRYRHSSEPEWKARIERGEVLLGGAPAFAADVLRPGQRLAWRRPPWQEPEVPLAFAILYRDAHLLATAKPRGLPTVPNGGFLDHTLLRLVRRRFPEATPMHRLGRGTSGIVLFARTPQARSALAMAWRRGQVEKSYRVLVAGVPERPSFAIETPIGPVPHPKLGHLHAACASGKASHTDVRVLAAREGNAIVEARIATGRPHQIRIHLAAAGHPLVGDPLYASGGVPVADPGLPGEGGYALHAHRLGLAHPATGRWLLIECGVPPLLRT